MPITMEKTRANGFVSMRTDGDATYTGFMVDGKYHGPGFYMSRDGSWVGWFRENNIINGVVITMRSHTYANEKLNEDSRVFNNYTNSLYQRLFKKQHKNPNIFFAEVKNGKYTREGLVTNSISYAAIKTFRGEIDSFGAPYGDAVVGGKEGYYQNGVYYGPTRKEKNAIAEAKKQERYYWLTQSSCGVKGEWVSLVELLNHKRKSGMRYQWCFHLYHRASQGLRFGKQPCEVSTTNLKSANATIWLCRFLRSNLGNCILRLMQMKSSLKTMRLFVIDSEVEDYYNPCGLCRGSGQLRVMSREEETNPVSARYTYYVINDPQGGYMIQKAIRHIREKELDTYGRNGLPFSQKTAIPCTQCFGMGIVPKQ